MSAEAFQTVLSCDVRTAPDGRGVEYAESGTRQPRWHEIDPETGMRVRGGWADCYLYAEGAVRIAADAVRDQEMTGLTGDHPERRQQAAAILDAAAELVRILALDHANDGALTDERWAEAISAVHSTVTVALAAG